MVEALVFSISVKTNPLEKEIGSNRKEKWNERSFHIWKQKMKLVFARCEAENTITTKNPFNSETTDYDNWN